MISENYKESIDKFRSLLKVDKSWLYLDATSNSVSGYNEFVQKFNKIDIKIISSLRIADGVHFTMFINPSILDNIEKLVSIKEIDGK